MSGRMIPAREELLTTMHAPCYLSNTVQTCWITWFVAVQDGAISVRGGEGEADCTISTTEENFQKILSGEQNATSAYMTGKLKIKGDMGAAMKLQKLF